MPLHPNQDFVVKENAGLQIVMGIFFLGLFIISLTDLVDAQAQQGAHFKAMYITLLPAAYLLWKGFSPKSAIMRINRHGFFYYGKLLTTWNNFHDARVTEKEVSFSIQDNFILLLRYRKADGVLYQRTIPLTNTQNKAEEEIIAAIRFYRDEHLKAFG